MVLDLDIEVVLPEQRGKLLCRLARTAEVACGKKARNFSRNAPGKRTEPFVIARKKLRVDARARIKALGKAARNKLNEVSVSDLVLTKQYEVMIVSLSAAAPVKA